MEIYFAVGLIIICIVCATWLLGLSIAALYAIVEAFIEMLPLYRNLLIVLLLCYVLYWFLKRVVIVLKVVEEEKEVEWSHISYWFPIKASTILELQREEKARASHIEKVMMPCRECLTKIKPEYMGTLGKQDVWKYVCFECGHGWRSQWPAR